MATLTIDIPNAIFSQIQQQEKPLEDFILDAVIKQLADSKQPKSKTWQLCGEFRLAEPEAAYVVGKNSQGPPITNYAEQVDSTLY
jgi:hypothetical protein